MKVALSAEPDKIPTLGIVHPTSMQNLILRYWLAAGGIDPDRDVKLIVLPPAQMLSNLKQGNIDGYCVGEPWNDRAVYEQVGYVIATALDIWPGQPEKVLGVREDWANKNPQTHIALVKALLEACEYCDNRQNREEILEIVCRPEYLNASPEYTRIGFIDPYNRGTGEKPQPTYAYNEFYVNKANYPKKPKPKKERLPKKI